ncbi:MAG: kelch repeat-containing protein [Phycisphaerales bacterium]
MAYDIARQRIVMTGGGYIVATAEVWEYDAQTHTWSQAPDLTDAQGLPLPRSGHAMSYDSTRNTMVLYGGLDAGVNGSLDVLERPSTTSTWSVRTATLNPGPQVGYAMAYDEERQLSVLIGEGTTAISVWEWDGAAGTWTPRSFTGSIPNARTNPAVVFDSARSRIVLAGGQANRNTWDYDGTTWVQRALIPSNGRDEHAMAYDPFNGRCLLYGGILNSATPQRDMLAFDGATNTWTTAWSRSDLGPRDLFGLCYDEVGGRSIVQGGALVTRAGIVQQFGAATFAFSGDAWTVPAATGSPGTRFFHPLVYDSSRRAVLMYGGATSNGSSNATARLWELNLASMTWSDLGVQAPGQRYDHAAAFDRVRNKMVIQGGIDDLGVRKGDTWIYDVTAGSWTQHPDSEPNPGLRNGAGMAFDEHRGVVVLFGGQIGTSGQYDNSTWEWNGTAWANVTPPNGNPPARVRLEMVYDPVRRTVVMFGGRMNSNNDFDVLHVGRAYRDLWEWDGIAWKRLAIESGPAPIGFVNARATYDRSRSRILHHGGASVDNRTYDNGQTWGLIMPSPTCGGPTCDSIDFNNDTSLFDPQDIEAFLSVYSEGPCVPSGATCGDIDFNNDTSVFDPCDINSFLVVYSEGPCTPCGT